MHIRNIVRIFYSWALNSLPLLCKASWYGIAGIQLPENAERDLIYSIWLDTLFYSANISWYLILNFVQLPSWKPQQPISLLSFYFNVFCMHRYCVFFFQTVKHSATRAQECGSCRFHYNHVWQHILFSRHNMLIMNYLVLFIISTRSTTNDVDSPEYAVTHILLVLVNGFWVLPISQKFPTYNPRTSSKWSTEQACSSHWSIHLPFIKLLSLISTSRCILLY